jgi:UDP-N-acetylmuramoylalanine--D-glutamate ligase
VELDGKRVVVVGLAQTGVRVARFARSRGARVVVTDGKAPAALEARLAELDAALDGLGGVAGIELELGGHREASFTGADLVVMSPGVPELAETRAARAAGVEVIAEIELAYRCLDPRATLIAITGTNGKSTTTALTGELCVASGRPTFCGGNLGNMPLIDAVDHPANVAGGLVVAEVAGFMLETCTSFRPHVAACLNITPDHLDRYGTLEAYAAMKTRIFEWQRPDDAAIGNASSPLVVEGLRRSAARQFLFDSRGEVSRGACLTADKQELRLLLDGEADMEDRLPPGRSSRFGSRSQVVSVDSAVAGRPTSEERYPASDLRPIGVHNLENAMAAYLAARLAGVAPDAIRRGAQAFRPQKHRMELVGQKDDVVYYDDSKGTNVDAVAASVRGFPRPVVLIAGGVDKGGSYAPMFDALAGVARGLVLIGQAAPLIRAAAAAHGVTYPVVDASDMFDAVVRATTLAHPGDAVVLSPACASYDMFKNFGERGMVFRAAVERAGARRLDG